MMCITPAPIEPGTSPKQWQDSIMAAVVPAKPEGAPDSWYPKRKGLMGDWGFAQDKASSAGESLRYITVSVVFIKAQQVFKEGVRVLSHSRLLNSLWQPWMNLCLFT